MSRQIQIRRGTSAENDAFTGAIGEITMDTTNKTLRIHDGETIGGTVLAKKSDIPEQYVIPENYDFVIESQMPNADNNYTWYRKYKSGWVEMGGISSNSQQVNLPVTMADTNYVITISGDCGIGNNNITVWGWRNKTTTSFITQGNIVSGQSQTAANNSGIKCWTVFGIFEQ